MGFYELSGPVLVHWLRVFSIMHIVIMCLLSKEYTLPNNKQSGIFDITLITLGAWITKKGYRVNIVNKKKQIYSFNEP